MDQEDVISARMDILESKFEKMFEMIQNLSNNFSASTSQNIEIKASPEEDDNRDIRPSRRDRQSIASIFTSEPFTPMVMEKERRNKEDFQKPDFLKDYIKVKQRLEQQNSNLIQEIIISENMKYSTVSLRTIKYATEKIQLHRTENPIGASNLKLAYFFNMSAMEYIFNKQLAKRTNILQHFENPTRFYAAEDDIFLSLLCDAVRPVSAEDHLVKLLSVIQLDYIDEVFQLKNFHKGPLAKAMTQLN